MKASDAIRRAIHELRHIAHDCNKEGEYEAAHVAQTAIVAVHAVENAETDLEQIEIPDDHPDFPHMTTTELDYHLNAIIAGMLAKYPGTPIAAGPLRVSIDYHVNTDRSLERRGEVTIHRNHEPAKAKLELSDRNHLIDAIRWLHEVPDSNPSHGNAQLTATHLQSMLNRLPALGASAERGP